MRVFLGIGLPAEVRRAIDDALAPLRSRRAPIGWVAVDNLHITLKFLGEISSDAVGRVRDALRSDLPPSPPFELTARGGGAFPTLRSPRVLWVGLGEPLELVGTLQQNIETVLDRAGFRPEDRPYHPHVTVGRVRAGLPKGWGETYSAHLAGRTFGAVPVWTFRLYESRLSPGGASYTVLEEFPLRGEKEKGAG